MKCRFMITGYATGGDKTDLKMWLGDSIKEYNQMPKVVDSIEVDVEEIENTHCANW
jgi:hypothetical protein